MKTAVFIGRFQPFHNGHLYAVKEILSENDRVKIILGSFKKNHTQNNPLKGDERAVLIKNALESEGFGGRFEIIAMADYNSDNQWVDEFLAKVGKVDIVYTGNMHTERCLSSHVKVKKQKIYKPEIYNATTIRDFIRKNKEWKELVPESISKNLKSMGLVEVIKMSGIPPDKVKDVAEFLSGIKNKRVAIIHHDDGDGICAGVLAEKIMENRGNKINQFTTRIVPRVTDDLYKEVAVLKPELIIMTDFADKTDKSANRFIEELGCDVVIVDHHVWKDYKFHKRVLYANPRVDIDKDRYTPASAYMYMIGVEACDNFERYNWIASLGTMTDFGVSENEEIVKVALEKYNDLFECGTLDNRELFGTTFGSIGNALSSGVSWGGWEAVDMITEALSLVDSPYEFLDAETKELKKIWSEFRKIDTEIDRLVADFFRGYGKDDKSDGKSPVVIYEIKSDYYLKSEISTIISSRVDPEKVVIIWQEYEDEIKISFRNQSGDFNMNEIVSSAVHGLEASGGGHPKASGANVSKKDFKEFMGRVVRKIDG